MLNHLRASLLLLVLCVVICCGLYPLALWAIGQAGFPSNASGSLVKVTGPDGKEAVVGSTLIAQPFTRDWYFQPRPSAVSFNASASGASNWGANNPKLRDRIARQLGPVVRYNPKGPKKDASVQKDVETWFAGFTPGKDESPRAVQWARDNTTLAQAWVKDDGRKAAVIEWLGGHPALLEEWKKSKPDAPPVDLADDKTVPFDDIAVAFFESWAADNPKSWPEPEDFEVGAKDGKGDAVKGKRFKPVTEGSDLQATFFDSWLRAHPDADLEPVPADMVFASGSGLDPHITLRNARYQLDRVVSARAEAAKHDAADVRKQAEAILRDSAFTPLGGLIGEPLVNVLEVNLALDRAVPLPGMAEAR